MSAYTSYSGLFSKASEALNYFAIQRSTNMFGVTSPSQRRYVKYLAKIIADSNVPPSKAMMLDEIKLSCLPQLESLGDENIYLCIEIFNTTDDPNNLVYTNVDNCFEKPYKRQSDNPTPIIFNPNCEIKNDTLIVIHQAKQNIIFSG